MTVNRRTFLKRSAALSSLPILGACDEEGSGGSTDVGFDLPDTDAGDTLELPELPVYEYDGPEGPATLFQHGVASGDPLSDGIILWTRCSTESGDPVEVWWEISLDDEFRQRLQVGTVLTDGDRDFTVKVDVRELPAGQSLFYRFFALGRMSAVGRTRTAPSGKAEHLRFAVCSCASYAHGYFHGYRRIAQRSELNAVIHLGDYIYEYATGQYGSIRSYDPDHEITTLEDYRRRYAHYRLDRDLAEAHRQHPFIHIWDDHESSNNSYRDGAENHTEGREGAWADRKAAAIQAFNEWVPIRSDVDDEGKIWRVLRFGDLVDLILLDTRLWGRDEEAGRTDTEAHESAERHLLGEDQEAWLTNELLDSTAVWRVLGQQVMIGEFRGGASGGEPGPIFNADQWDGYAASRSRLYDLLENESIEDVVVLTGDIHTSWANDLPRVASDPASYTPETGEGSLAVEFVTPGISSPGLGALGDVIGPALQDFNPHVKFVDLENRGYIVLDVTAEHCEAQWYLLDTVESVEATESFAAAFATRVGDNHLLPVESPSGPGPDAPAPAP